MLALAPNTTEGPEQRAQSLQLVWHKPEIGEKRRPSPRRAPTFSVTEFDEIAGATRALAQDRRALNRRRALARTAVMKDEAVSRTGVIVFDYLQGAANFAEHGYAFPSVKRIAEKTGKSERAVRNSLKPLEFGRYVAIKLRWVRGFQAPSWYAFPCLTIDWSSRTYSACTSACTSECTSERRDGARQGATDVHSDIRNYPLPNIPLHTHPGSEWELFSQLKERVPGCERFIEQFLSPLLSSLDLKANGPLQALVDLAKQFKDQPDTALRAALETLWSERTENVKTGHIRNALSGPPARTVPSDQIVIKRELDPEAFDCWHDYNIRVGDHDAARFMRNQGVWQADTRFPPGHQCGGAA